MELDPDLVHMAKKDEVKAMGSMKTWQTAQSYTWEADWRHGEIVRETEGLQQKTPKHLTVECDSDVAGCMRTRKSTSGYVSFLGRHCVAARSKTQSVIATSSGEAELYALGSAISNGLGICAVLADLGVRVKLIGYGRISWYRDGEP